MKTKNDRIETLRRLILTTEMSSQEEVLAALAREGHVVPQSTLSRYFKQLKVAKAMGLGGKYVYVLPTEPMYRRIHSQHATSAMLQMPGFRSLDFSGNIGVVHTAPGYAAAIASNIDAAGIPEILGTVAGDDTIIMVVKEGATADDVMKSLSAIMSDKR